MLLDMTMFLILNVFTPPNDFILPFHFMFHYVTSLHLTHNTPAVTLISMLPLIASLYSNGASWRLWGAVWGPFPAVNSAGLGRAAMLMHIHPHIGCRGPRSPLPATVTTLTANPANYVSGPPVGL